jgi:uracil-DNA glycosylase family 4
VTPSLLGLLRQACIECRACPLRDGAVSEVTPVFGRRGDTSEVQIADPDPAAIRLVIVGEAPGPQENTVGRPFIGPAGDILASLLLQAGIDTGKVWITNAVACWPHEAGKSGRASTVSPSPHALSVCPDRHLGPQLDVFSKAPVVLALGMSAAVATIAMWPSHSGRGLQPVLASSLTQHGGEYDVVLAAAVAKDQDDAQLSVSWDGQVLQLAPFNTRGDESGTPLRVVCTPDNLATMTSTLLVGYSAKLAELDDDDDDDADDAEQLALEPPEGYAVQGTAVRLPNGTWIEAEALAASDVRHDGRCPVLAAWMHALVAWQSAALSAGFRLASAGRLEARAAIRDGAVIVYVYEGGGDRVGPAHVRGGTSDQRHAVLSRLRTLGLCAGGHNAKAAGLRWLPVQEQSR